MWWEGEGGWGALVGAAAKTRAALKSLGSSPSCTVAHSSHLLPCI